MSQDMSWEQAAAAIARMHAEQEAQDRAHRATLTPHVRVVQQGAPTRHSSVGPHAREPEPARTLCSAEPTIVDWDARTAASKTHARAAEQQVCPACLELARARAAAQKTRSDRRRQQRTSGQRPRATAKQVDYAMELLTRTGHDPHQGEDGTPDPYTVAILGLRPSERDRPVLDVLTAMSPPRISAAISNLRAELS